MLCLPCKNIVDNVFGNDYGGGHMTIDDNWQRNDRSADCLIFYVFYMGFFKSKVDKSLILDPNNSMSSCYQWHKGK